MKYPFKIFPSIGYLNTDFQIVPYETIELKVYRNNELIHELLPQKDEIVLLTQLDKPGEYTIVCNYENQNYSQKIEVKDAYRIGDSSLKKVYVFDGIAYSFFVMKDRMYIYDEIRKLKLMENHISPSEIKKINDDYLLLITHDVQNTNTNYGLFSIKALSIIDERLNNFNEIDLNPKYLWVNNWENNTIECFDISGGGFQSIFSVEANRYEANDEKSHLFIDTPAQIIICDLFAGKIKYVEKNPNKAVDKNGFEYELKEKQNMEYKGHIDCISGKFYLMIQKINFISDTFFWVGNNLKGTKPDTLERIANILFEECKHQKGFVNENVIKQKINEFSVTHNLISHETFPTEKGIFVLTNTEVKHFSTIKCERQYKEKEWECNPQINSKKSSSLVFHGERKVIKLKESITEVIRYQKRVLTVKTEEKQFSYYGENIIDSSNDFEKEQELKAPVNPQEEKSKNAVIGETVALSESQNKIISKRDSKFYLQSFNAVIKEYDNPKEISIGENNYEESYLSPDGKKLVLKNKTNKYVLYDYEQKKEIKFFSEKFVAFSKEGNLIFSIEQKDFTRKAKIIDPLTFQDITPYNYRYYKFLSPDGTLYATSSVCEKYFCKLRNQYIMLNKYNALKQFLTLPQSSTNEQKQQVDRNKRSYFTKHESQLRELGIQNYKDISIQSLVCVKPYIRVGIVGTDIYKDIPLPDYCMCGLHYFNYASFSYDNKYLGIVGKPGDKQATSSGGFIQIAKLEFNDYLKTLKFSGNLRLNPHFAKKAIWTCGFNPQGVFAFYDSNPTTYIFKNLDSNRITYSTLEDKNYLCFSPSGKYMALSDQGYSPISLGGCGHQQSCNVYLYDIESLMPIKSFSEHGATKEKEVKNINFVAFSEDEKRLMTHSRDGVVIIHKLNLKQ